MPVRHGQRVPELCPFLKHILPCDTFSERSSYVYQFLHFLFLQTYMYYQGVHYEKRRKRDTSYSRARYIHKIARESQRLANENRELTNSSLHSQSYTDLVLKSVVILLACLNPFLHNNTKSLLCENVKLPSATM